MALSGRTRSARGLVVLLVTASLVTITIDYREGSDGPLSKVGSAAVSVIAPLQDAVTRAFRPVATFFSALAHLPSLEDENRRLKNDLRAAKADAAAYESLQKRYADVTSVLDIRDTLFEKLPTTGATVISNGVSNFEWIVWIDKGSASHIKVDMPVVAAGGLIGHVVQVGLTGSEVQLILDPDSRVAARLVSSTQSGVLQGRGDDDPTLTLIGSRTPVEVGEPVETAGYQLSPDERGLYPSGIPIGTVAAVHDTPGIPEKEITVRPNVDFTSLDYVLVVLSTQGG